MKKKAGNTARKFYKQLTQAFPLRPIGSDARLRDAVAVVDSLALRGDRDEDEDNYLTVLALIVEDYENRTHPRPPVSDGAMLRSLLASAGVKQAKLAKATGIAESTISEVLADKRALRRAQIGLISRFFGVSPSAFDFDGPDAVRRPIVEPEDDVASAKPKPPKKSEPADA